MTYEEAIKNLKEWRDFAERRGSYYGEEAIPTYNLSIEALEKQIPTKPNWVCDDEPLCPYCQAVIEDGDAICENCHQLIDWSE